MDIRKFTEADREACLAIFESNSPAWFHPSELSGLVARLDAPGDYFVAEHDGRAIGAGGFDGSRIVWLMVDASFHGNGVGRFLMMYLLRELARGGFATVELGTTPAVVPFYEKFGFRTTQTFPDGWAPGFDRVEMIKKMDVCP